MKKSTRIIAGITAAVLTLGIAGCTKSTVYPNFINSEISGETPTTAEKYVINVTSEGGFKLNGVRVNALSNGQVVKQGLSVDGKIEFAIGLGEYELQVVESSLPAGYSLPDTTYKTNATSREPVDIRIPSSLIPAVNSSQCTYTAGTIMRDFTFTATDGTYTLSELLKTKKAVILNFWYSGCGPCRSEFPAIQKAYSSRNDIEILALCSTHQGDTQQIVSKFKEDNGLHFPMGIDTLGLTSSFGVGAFPTTFVIDRYGMIAYRSQGSDASANSWTSLFNKFTSDNYSQGDLISQPGTPGETPVTPIEREKPDVEMPASSVLEAAANEAGFTATYRAEDDEYSWPWLAGRDADGTYIYSSNTGKGNSYSIVYADIEMKKDEVLSFEYNVDSEAGYDFLYVFIDGDLISGEGYSATDGWVPTDAYVADRNRTVELSFAFVKDEADIDTYKGEDVAKVRNIHLSDKSVITKPIDVLRTCASGETDNFHYEHYEDVALGDDGYYHTENGALVYISLNNLTPWTKLHTTSITTTGSNTYYSTLYHLTYYNYAVSTESSFNVTIDGLNITKDLQTYWGIQGYMPGPYYLIPVNDKLKAWAQKFAEDYGKKQLGQKAYDDTWLEFCYYYDHYGSNDYSHEDGDCWATEDHTRGLTVYNAFKAYEKTDPEISTAEKYNSETGRMKAEISYPLENERNGTYYEFTPNETGIYQIRSYTKGCSSQGTYPGLSIYNANGNITGSADEILNFDQWLPTSQGGVIYEGFNHYVNLRAGETVYLMLEDEPGTTGYYEFEIEYIGTSHSELMICSTGGGMWGGNNGNNYLGIRYVMGDDGYYYAANSNGTPNMDSPIYIDMVYTSYLYNEIASLETLEYIIEKRIIDRNIKGGDIYQSQLETYLADAKLNGVDVELNGETRNIKGLVRADKDLVEIINKFIDKYVDGGRGAGNGWLAFAAYVRHM